jgi:hypothetical protein
MKGNFGIRKYTRIRLSELLNTQMAKGELFGSSCYFCTPHWCLRFHDDHSTHMAEAQIDH